VLTHVSDADYDALNVRAADFGARLASAITEGGMAVSVPVFGPLVGLFLDSPNGKAGPALTAPVDYVTAKELAGNGVYARFFHAMLRRGVALAPGPYEVMFPGLAHGEDVLRQVVDAAGESAHEVSSG
jgi:glutamate-1-semialdehyde 2,1-aminomutase